MKYERITQALHWLMGLLIIGEVGLALVLEDMPESDTATELMQFHKSLGVLLLLLIVFRIIWRIRSEAPPPLETLAEWEKTFARHGHHFLYLLMALLPLSGWMMSSAGGHTVSLFGLFNLPPVVPESDFWHEAFESIHVVAGNLLILMILLHIAAVIKHQVIDKKDVLSRMV